MLKLLVSILLVSGVVSAQERTRPPRRPGEMPQQEPGAQSQRPAQKPGAIEGRVVNLAGEPVRKADVTLNAVNPQRGPGGFFGPGNAGYAVSTDPSGVFRFTDVEPGRYMVNANRAGYVSTQRGRAQRPVNVVVQAGETSTGVEIKLTPQGVITGKVTDEDGDILQNIQVQVMQRRYVRGRRQLMPVGGGMANDLGEFRLANLYPGQYFVTAQRPPVRGMRVNSQKVEEGYATTFFPGVAEAKQALAIEVQAGQERAGVDIRLLRTKVFHVRGRVLDVTGNNRLNILAVLLPEDQGFSGFDRLNSPVRPQDGSFDIGGAPAGSYSLNVFQMRGENRYSGRAQVHITDSNVEGIVVQMQESTPLAASIRAEEGASVKLQGIQVTLEPAMMEGGFAMPSGEQSDDSGNLSIKSVLPGRYAVNVRNLPAGTYLKSIKLAAQESSDGLLDIVAGAGPLEFLLGVKPGVLTGSILEFGGQAAPEATVVLIPDSPQRSRAYLFQSVRASGDGQFTIQGIAPGDYTLLAFDHVEEGAWFDPDFLRPLESKALTVKVTESSTQNVQLKIN